MDNTVDPNCPRCGQTAQTLEHWLDCPGTLQARLAIFTTTEAPPLFTLSAVPGQLGHTGKTYSVTTWGARHQQQRQQHHHQQQQQQQQQQWWRRRWRRQRRGLHESFIRASAAAGATAVGLAGVGRRPIRDEQRAAWLASLRSRPHPHSIFGRPSGLPAGRSVSCTYQISSPGARFTKYLTIYHTIIVSLSQDRLKIVT